MRRVSLLSVLAGIGLAAPVSMAASLNYREAWDSYAVGRTDATYNAVWTCNDPTDYPIIGTVVSSSTPNSLTWEKKDRTLVNSLVDGVSNVALQPTNAAAVGYEMNAGEVVKPVQALQGTAGNLTMAYDVGFTANPQRALIGSYVELGFGTTQHAPTSSLATAIPLLAVGKLNGKFTDSSGSAGNNNQPYFFNGQKWYRCGNSTFHGANVNEEAKAEIFYDGGRWQAQVTLTNGLYNGINVFDLAFDPTAQGFNTVSWVEMNSGQNFTGNCAADDIKIMGGVITPDPASLLLLGLGGLSLLRRRRHG